MSGTGHDDNGGKGRKGETGDLPLGPEIAIEFARTELIEQATEDASFRKQLLGDPDKTIAGALSDRTRTGLPKGLKFRVVEETPDRLYLVIPHRRFEGTLDRTDSHQLFLTRALEDKAFRRRLQRDARAAVEEAFFVELPDGLQIEVLEEQRGERILVLPLESGEFRADHLRHDLVAAKSSGWCGRTLKTVVTNLCQPDTFTDIRCQDINTNDVTDPNCAPQTCTPTWTWGQ